MRYFIDFEFTKFNGKIMSLGIVSEYGHELYLVRPAVELNSLKGEMSQFVTNVVIPALVAPGADPKVLLLRDWIPEVSFFLKRTMREDKGKDKTPIFCVDWPEDLKHFMTLLLTGPGTMVGLPDFMCEVYRSVESYPTVLTDAVPHNALWDARALKAKLIPA